ncbi:MAG: glycosyltransferase family 2 protein [Thermodesulfobacteriota bacterium]
MEDNADITVLVPCYNEMNNIPPFLEEIVPVLDTLPVTWEMLFINDGSTDATAAVIAAAHGNDHRIKCLSFSRNFGKEAALTCGLGFAKGRAVLIIDADLQHPPAVIPEMIRLWREEGYDMVVPLNTARTGEGIVKKHLTRLYYRILRIVTQVDILPGGSDFRLIDGKVVAVINQLPERTRFMKGIYAWAGFRVTSFPYLVRTRRLNQSKWKFVRLWNFALDGLFGFSTFPLRLWTYVGFLIAFLSFLRGLMIGVDALLHGIHVARGVTTVAVFLFFLIGLLMVSNGIQGEYLARVYEEVKGRPLYVIASAIGIEDPEKKSSFR